MSFSNINESAKLTKHRRSIDKEVYSVLKTGEKSLQDLIWNQHLYHEYRRWSAGEFIEKIDLNCLTEDDKYFIYNAGRAELTTKPGADRLSNLADKECRYWEKKDPALSAVMQACGTWSRYWNEEESHHEMSLLTLSKIIGYREVDNVTIIDYRRIFPDDDMLRTLAMLTFSECAAAAQYAAFSDYTHELNLKKLTRQISQDEIQHMNYFIGFAKALVNSGHYSPKGVFAIGHLFLKDGGELEGSTRAQTEKHRNHVNWWDHVEDTNNKIRINNARERKEKLMLTAIHKMTGIHVSSPTEVEDTWMELVSC